MQHGRQLDERRNRKQPKLAVRRSRNVERQHLRNPLGRGRKCSGAAVMTNPLKTSACIIVGRGSKNDGALEAEAKAECGTLESPHPSIRRCQFRHRYREDWSASGTVDYGAATIIDAYSVHLKRTDTTPYRSQTEPWMRAVPIFYRSCHGDVSEIYRMMSNFFNRSTPLITSRQIHANMYSAPEGRASISDPVSISKFVRRPNCPN